MASDQTSEARQAETKLAYITKGHLARRGYCSWRN